MKSRYKRFSGAESFLHNGMPTGDHVSSFWAWAYSELDSNIVRSVLAEYIVASALEITDLPGEDFRQMWRPYDLMFEGKRIEVKSASTVQTWNTRNKGNFTFSIAPARVPDENGDYKEDAPLRRNSDIYVFCIFDPESEDISPLNLDAWTFYIVPTRVFDEKLPVQKTISINPLMKLNPVKCSFDELQDTIRRL